MRPVVLGLAVVVVAAQACGETCRTTCRRYYDLDQCNGPTGGVPRDEQTQACIETCSEALRITGPAPLPNDPEFNPEIPSTNPKPALSNEQEVAAWIDCVWSFPTADECEAGMQRNACVIVP